MSDPPSSSDECLLYSIWKYPSNGGSEFKTAESHCVWAKHSTGLRVCNIFFHLNCVGIGLKVFLEKDEILTGIIFALLRAAAHVAYIQCKSCFQNIILGSLWVQWLTVCWFAYLPSDYRRRYVQFWLHHYECHVYYFSLPHLLVGFIVGLSFSPWLCHCCWSYNGKKRLTHIAFFKWILYIFINMTVYILLTLSLSKISQTIIKFGLISTETEAHFTSRYCKKNM